MHDQQSEDRATSGGTLATKHRAPSEGALRGHIPLAEFTRALSEPLAAAVFGVLLPKNRPCRHRLRTKPHRIVLRAARFIYWIGLDQLGSMLLGVSDRTGKKSLCDSVPPVFGRNNEADDRPDGLIVDGLHNGRACQPRILFSRSDGNPTDGHLAPVANESGRTSGFHEFLQLSSVYFSPCGARWWRCLGAAQPIGQHQQPRATEQPFGFEDRLEVDPALWREGQNA